MRIVAKAIIVAAGIMLPALAHATETTTYVYDAKGRLVQAAHSGNVNNGVTTSYAHDNADNRTNVTTSGPCTIQALDRSTTVVPGYFGSVNYYILTTSGTCAGVVLNYSTQNGTATSGVNYTAKSGSLTLDASPSLQAIQIANVGLQNSTEKYFYMNISSSTSSVTITDSQSQIYLYSD